jgi:hypothetical protein
MLNHAKKDPKGKKNCHYDLGISWLGVRIVSLSIYPKNDESRK